VFVVLEGIDGSGKTEQLARLASRLRSEGREVEITEEPTEGEWGRRYRRYARGEIQASAADLVEWFVRDRHEHVARIVLPALEAGRLLLCARYVASTIAYQSAGGENFDRLCARMLGERFPEPHRVLWLRLPVRVALARLSAAGRAGRERFERAAFLERVDAAYARLGLCEVDAAAEPEAVTDALLAQIRSLL
jgi:dTMP kinase